MGLQLLIDFETKCDIDLTKRGLYNYVNHPSFDAVCLAYLPLDDSFEPLDKIKLWTPRRPLDPIIELMDQRPTVYAHNVFFDYQAWNHLPAFPFLPLQQCVDVMALCGRFTIPQALDFAGKVMKIKSGKDTQGKRLMKKICTPPYKYNQEDLTAFYKYCVRDVKSMYQLLMALPATALSPEENRYWQLTANINATGIPVDIQSCRIIIDAVDKYTLQKNIELDKVTKGAVTRVTQVQRIKQFCSDRTKSPDKFITLDQEHLAQILKDPLPPDVEWVLNLRQEIGLSSVAKFRKMDALSFDGELYDSLRYYGANTGRYAGKGVQFQNLPRAKVEEPEKEIQLFYDYLDNKPMPSDWNPVKIAKALIRPMVKAPTGYRLAAADYSAIENVVLAWVAEDEKTIDLFEQGLSQYKDMASYVYQVPYADVDETQRQFGKLLVLGCGYGLGHIGFLNNAAKAGIDLTLPESKDLVNKYRTRYKRVVKLWYAGRDAAVSALQNPTTPFAFGKGCQFTCIRDKNKNIWLQLTLPSQRNLYYFQPEVERDQYGYGITHMGLVSSIKKWRRQRLIPGRITENIIQATSRDILMHGKEVLTMNGYSIIFSVHDEIVLIIEEAEAHQESLDKIINLMCDLPQWAKGIPLKAKGFIGRRYKKD